MWGIRRKVKLLGQGGCGGILDTGRGRWGKGVLGGSEGEGVGMRGRFEVLVFWLMSGYRSQQVLGLRPGSKDVCCESLSM